MPTAKWCSLPPRCIEIKVAIARFEDKTLSSHLEHTVAQINPPFRFDMLDLVVRGEELVVCDWISVFGFLIGFDVTHSFFDCFLLF
jgi:hypothetical protein